MEERLHTEEEAPQGINGEDQEFLPPALLDDKAVEKFEKGIELFKRFKITCYRLTNESHWINHSKDPDKPQFYLQSPGCEALMTPLGMEYEEEDLRIWREDLQDAQGESFYRYWIQGEMYSKTLRRRGAFIGCCDSRDQFFNARQGWNPYEGEGDIKKAALSNWIVNAVTRLAGLRKPRPEDLIAAGLDLSKIQNINYRAQKPQVADDADLKPGVIYAGTLTSATPSKDKKPGQIAVQTEHGQLVLSFFGTPDAFAKVQDWRHVTGRKCNASFTEKAGRDSRVWRNLDHFEFVNGQPPQLKPQAQDEDPHDGEGKLFDGEQQPEGR